MFKNDTNYSIEKVIHLIYTFVYDMLTKKPCI